MSSRYSCGTRPVIRTVVAMKNTRRSIQFIAVTTALSLGSAILASGTAYAAPKAGCADLAAIQELSKGLGGLNPAGTPKTEAAKFKKSADKLKALMKTAPKELKPDYEFMAKLMGDLSVSFLKIDLAKPETVGKALEPLTKGATKLSQVGPHFSAYAAKNCK
jgi:hypothetical protein